MNDMHGECPEKCTEVDEEEDEDEDECGGEDEKFQRVWVFDLCEK